MLECEHDNFVEYSILLSGSILDSNDTLLCTESLIFSTLKRHKILLELSVDSINTWTMNAYDMDSCKHALAIETAVALHMEHWKIIIYYRPHEKVH